MNKTTKILLAVGVTLIVGGVGFYIYNRSQMATEEQFNEVQRRSIAKGMDFMEFDNSANRQKALKWFKTRLNKAEANRMLEAIEQKDERVRDAMLLPLISKMMGRNIAS